VKMIIQTFKNYHTEINHLNSRPSMGIKFIYLFKKIKKRTISDSPFLISSKVSNYIYSFQLDVTGFQL
jgi:hypothetical protein